MAAEIDRARALLLQLRSRHYRGMELVLQQPSYEISPQPTQLEIKNSNPISLTHDFQQTIDQQKQLAKQLDKLHRSMSEIKQIFELSLDQNCPVPALISLQSLIGYLQKEVELVKELKQVKPQALPKTDNSELRSIFEQRRGIELNRILLFVKQKMLAEKLKYMRENMLADDILLYDQGNIKKINQINTKIQIDGPVIQKQLEEKLVSIKQLVSKKLDAQEQQVLMKTSRILSLQEEKNLKNLEHLGQAVRRAEAVQLLVQSEFSLLNGSLQAMKAAALDDTAAAVYENKTIITYERELTRPPKYFDEHSELYEYFKNDKNLVDSDKVLKQIKIICQHPKTVVLYTDNSKYAQLQDCLQRLRTLAPNIRIPPIELLRQQFLKIQRELGSV